MEAIELSLSTVYTEELTELHSKITHSAISEIAEFVGPDSVRSVLDVGCGMGVAWPSFRKSFPNLRMIDVITPDEKERSNASASDVTWVGRTISECKPIEFAGYDLIWARHSLEHTISPFSDLVALGRMLSLGGMVYVEVPSPGTVCNHEMNPNHYSVLTDKMWLSLFNKAGFKVEHHGAIEISLEIGKDTYFWYILKR